ncbi:vWA domain-containing protein [Candidatus Rariloculus sp.]|uniref:vWA domain-containing protein n=1 Tax=Candidatus Rariloculus sp. TaxID=3101265 RepID=UPI003D104438
MAHRTDTEPGRRLSDCVTALLRDHPFFGSLTLRLPLVADPSRKTLASDGLNVRYNPDWVTHSGADAIQTALARVVLACALKHHTRRGERQPERWQRASQLVTHGLLRDAGFTLPPEAEAWDGLSVEQAYDRLPEPDEQGDSPGSGPGAGGGAGASEPGNAGSSPPASPPTGGPQPKPDNADDPPPSVDPAGTGEILDATERTAAQGSPPQGSSPPDIAAQPATGSGDNSGQAPLSVLDIAAEEQAWDEAMHQAASVARAQGKVPGAVETTIRNAHRSRLDWRSLLRRYLLDTAENDYTWSVPNRRFIDSGLYLPSVRSEGMGAIALIIDTSGSLPLQMLETFWAEIREIADELEPERIILLQVDTALRRADEYSPGELPEQLSLTGRGGTDFRPGFQWLDEQGIRPACCLYFTDMECNRYPDAEPDFAVLWINYGDPPSDRYREPWGERIDLLEEAGH